MYLHLDVDSAQYPHASQGFVERGPKVSFFKGPITNTHPLRSYTLSEVYNLIVGPYYIEETEKLRTFEDKKQARIFKAANFDYVTFCGEFDIRSNDTVKTVSNLLCVDFDHVPDVEGLFNLLLEDQCFETALLFRSPSGDGLKWVIEINKGNLAHDKFFLAVDNYIQKTYGLQVDKSGKDISRACFICYDPQAYINPNYR
jgi:hypothetical protein